MSYPELLFWMFQIRFLRVTICCKRRYAVAHTDITAYKMLAGTHRGRSPPCFLENIRGRGKTFALFFVTMEFGHVYIVEIKEENTRRVRELEAELSDERFAELFNSEEDASDNTALRKKTSARTRIVRLVVIVVIVVCLLALLLQFNPKITYEKSMKDTIMPRDAIVLSVNAYKNEGVGFGDIIIHDSPIEDPEGGMYEMCTRVIGLPGDVIEIKDGGVYRNEERLDEPYVKEGRTEGVMAQFLVPEALYFVLGDNRQDSVDSRDPRLGLVMEGEIKGKVVFRILPFSRIGAIK